MKFNDAALSPKAAVAYELGAISNELRSLLDRMDARDAAREAKRQQHTYAWKPWTPGVPTADARGNSIVFLEAGAGVDARYWVCAVQPNGAHVRTVPGNRFTTIAPTETQALWLGAAHVAGRGLIEPHIESKFTQPDGWTEVRYLSYSSR